ncbi:MAG: MXAN_5187 C-terminal domain-containing protein [Polyangiaceae bacterium]
MRGKIFGVFAVVVLVVVGLSYALTRAILVDLPAPGGGEASRSVTAVTTQLKLDALVLERWLAERAAEPKLREPFNAGTAPARSEAAMNVANQVRDAAASSAELATISPALVVLVDAKGIVLGRNGSATMRGDDLGAVYPALKDALQKGITGSDAWINPARNEQLLASYAPIRGADGAVIGGLVLGTAFNDGRLNTVSERMGGGAVVAIARKGEDMDVIAKSGNAPSDLLPQLGTGSAKEGALKALSSGQTVDLGGLPKDFAAAARPLDGYGEGRSAAVVGIARVEAPKALGAILWPNLGVLAFGLVLVGIGAHLLSVYLSRPVAEMEEGLLTIMNGKTDLRFEIEHAEYGGLAFRINSLLNQLFGVQEDETDEQGRPSRAPSSTSFQDALAVDERMATSAEGGDGSDAKALREEADEGYYQRIFEEYIAGKRSLGDPVDHITREAFVTRIRASEAEMAQKHGKPVRYKVEVRGKEVVLLAVPLV